MRAYKSPVFSTKHYETLVDFLAELRVNQGITELTLLEGLKDLFEADNKRFNIHKFLTTYDRLKDKYTQEALEQSGYNTVTNNKQQQ